MQTPPPQPVSSSNAELLIIDEEVRPNWSSFFDNRNHNKAAMQASCTAITLKYPDSTIILNS